MQVLLFFVASLLVSSSNLFADSTEHLSPTLAKILKKKELVVSMPAEDTPPFFFTDSNKKQAGFDVELAEQIAQQLGVQVRYIRTSKDFLEVIHQVNTGAADLAAAALFYTPERAKLVYFSQPYYKTVASFVINRVALSRLKLKDPILSNINHPKVRIGIRETNPFRKMFEQQYANAQIKFYPSRETLIADLQKGSIDCAAIDEIELAKWKKLIPQFGIFFQNIRDDIHFIPISIATQSTDPHFQYWINEYFHYLEREGVMDRLRKKYFEGTAYSL